MRDDGKKEGNAVENSQVAVLSVLNRGHKINTVYSIQNIDNSIYTCITEMCDIKHFITT